jgi:hypothetical protein
MGIAPIPPERFESLVRAVAADWHTPVKVSGFEFVLRLKGRRMSYWVRAVYDPVANHWMMYDPYRGNKIRFFIDEIERRLKE